MNSTYEQTAWSWSDIIVKSEDPMKCNHLKIHPFLNTDRLIAALALFVFQGKVMVATYGRNNA